MRNQTAKLFLIIFGTIVATALMLLATYGFVGCMESLMPDSQPEQNAQAPSTAPRYPKIS